MRNKYAKRTIQQKIDKLKKDQEKIIIQIDIDMPKNCFECDKTYKWKKIGRVQCYHINMPSISSDTTNRPSYCPLKEVSNNSVLEDIEARHNPLSVECINNGDVYVLGKNYDAVQVVLETLRKYQKIEQIINRPIGNNAEEKAYNYMMIVKDIKKE